MHRLTAASIGLLLALSSAPSALAQLQPPLPSPNATALLALDSTRVYVGTQSGIAVLTGGFEIEYGWGGLLIDEATWQVKRLSVPSFWGHKHSTELPPPSTITPI